ncbi:MAG TPA: hypothetical protein VG407_08835 [Caulobacteraceae bacterium]|jgi:hypothetical protein|nr:hypothetical protein [Caulobacteraceae bacterium]
MHAFDYVVLFFSFVYAGAIMHLLATAAEIIIAGKRVRRSWLNAGWMLTALLGTSSWWIGMWDLRGQASWAMGMICLFFCVACGFYLLSRLVSPRIEAGADVDLVAFHVENGRKYIAVFAALCVAAIAVNTLLGAAVGVGQWVEQNVAIIPMLAAAILAAIFVRKTWLQFACLAVVLAMWGWYFSPLQGALKG